MRRSKWKFAALSAVLVSVACSGCGGGGRASALDAAGVVAGLQAAGFPIQGSRTYTAADDPNSLLGRPGQYVSKANFHDARVESSDDLGIDGGGSVETFANKTDASNRAKYVRALATSSLFSEYDFLDGTTLLRLSHGLKPDDASAYETALKQVAEGKRLTPVTTSEPATVGTTASTEAITTTTETTTTTTRAAITRAEADTILADNFNKVHAQLDSTLRADSQTEAVNDISYNPKTNTINIDLASTYTGGATFRTFYDGQAWGIGQGVAGWFWASAVVNALQTRGGSVALLPTLAITLDGLRYVCPPAIENGVSTKSVSMETWLATCRK